MRPDEAEQFYEEDEDPERVFAQFNAAGKGRTAPPDDHGPAQPDLEPVAEVLNHIRRELRKLRLLERAAVAARHLADLLRSHTRV